VLAVKKSLATIPPETISVITEIIIDATSVIAT
jgi:hypothetical protein